MTVHVVDAAFSDFVEREGDGLLRYAVLLLGDRQDAEDAVQLGLERAFSRWDRLAGEKPTAYVRATVLNQARDRHRRKLVRRMALPRLAERSAVVHEGLEDRFDLLRTLRQLPPRQRAVLLLRFWMDLSEAEIARELGCSVGTVKSQVSRGLARLRELLPEGER